MEFLTNFVPMSTTPNLKELMPSARGGEEQPGNTADSYHFTRLRTDGLSDGATGSLYDWLGNNGGPMRMDGMMCLLCLEGELDLELNLEALHLSPASLLVAMTDSLIDLKSVADGPVECCVLHVSMDFLNQVNFDLNVLGEASSARRHTGFVPVIKLSDDEREGLVKHFDLIDYTRRQSTSVPQSTSVYGRSIARCLMAAVIYRMIEIFSSRIDKEPGDPLQNSRRLGYVHRFIKLVHQHHSRERSVGFYAERLFISPKYLSLIIKEHTGRSAAQIIDNFVILEAKNLLRFSGKNIQQVAYELNFPNQSSFGKYFKHLTGLSPSEYQRS